MEKPMFTAIDYNSHENLVIEGLVRDNYLKVKEVFEKVLYERINNPRIQVGLCADLIRACNELSEDKSFWRRIIKPWFTLERFNLTDLYFSYSTELVHLLKEETKDLHGRLWFRVSIHNLKEHEWLSGTAFWFPVSVEYNVNRIKILECALEDLERIKKEGEPKLPPITEDEPIIY